MMENPIEWIAPLEINPKCAIKYKRSQVVTDAHIHSLQHTYTLHVSIIIKIIQKRRLIFRDMMAV